MLTVSHYHNDTQWVMALSILSVPTLVEFSAQGRCEREH